MEIQYKEMSLLIRPAREHGHFFKKFPRKLQQKCVHSRASLLKPKHDGKLGRNGVADVYT